MINIKPKIQTIVMDQHLFLIFLYGPVGKFINFLIKLLSKVYFEPETPAFLKTFF